MNPDELDELTIEEIEACRVRGPIMRKNAHVSSGYAGYLIGTQQVKTSDAAWDSATGWFIRYSRRLRPIIKKIQEIRSKR